MKILWLFFAATFLAGCQKTISYKQVNGTGYVQVENSLFDRMLVGENTRFSKYDRLIFSELTFDTFQVSSSHNSIIDRTWTITDADKGIYSRYFKDELVKVYGGDNAQTEFGLGSGLNEQTLRAEFRLVKLIPNTAKHGENVSGTISRQSTESFGTLYIQILLVDSLTNEFVALIEDGKDLSTERHLKPLINRTNDSLAWKRAFAGWLRDLKDTAAQLKANEQVAASSI